MGIRVRETTRLANGKKETYTTTYASYFDYLSSKLINNCLAWLFCLAILPVFILWQALKMIFSKNSTKAMRITGVFIAIIDIIITTLVFIYFQSRK